MTWLEWTLVIVFTPLNVPALAVAYTVFIQHERGGAWALCKLVGLIGFPLDVAANYLTLAIVFWERPQPGAYTFSKQLEHLIKDMGLRGFVAWRVAKVINWIAPSGKHVDLGGDKDV